MKKLVLIFWLFQWVVFFGQISVFTEDFVDNRNFWHEVETDSVRAKIENGVYSLESKSSKPLFFWNSNLPIDYEKDFRIEFIIPSSQILNQNLDFIYCGRDSYNYACVRLLKGTRAHLYGYENGKYFEREAPYYLEGPLPKFIDSLSTVSLDIYGDKLRIYVNNDFVSIFKYSTIKGNQVGFLLSNESKIKIHSIQIFQPENQLWLSENMLSWNNPKSNLEITKKGKVELDYQLKSYTKGVSDQLLVNNEISETKLVKLNRGLNFIELTLSDSLNHSLSMYKIIRRGKPKKSPNSKAILFANDTFEEWENLNNPKNDVDSIKKTLEFIYGYEVDIIYNSTKDEIQRYLANIQIKKKKQLLVYFAGHGALDTLGNSYWVCTDSKLTDNSGESYLSWSEIISCLDTLNFQQELLVTDVCYSGRITNLDTLRTYDCPYNNQIFVASGNEIVSDGEINSHSPFAIKFISDLSNYWSRGLIINNFNLGATFYLYSEVKFGSFGDACKQGNYIFVPR